MIPSERYAFEVATHLERLPRRARQNLASELAAEFSEYPEAATFEALTGRLGPPAWYAVVLARELAVKPGRRVRPRGWKSWAALASIASMVAWLLLATSPDPVTDGGSFGPGDFDTRWVELSTDVIFRFEPGHEGTFMVSVANQGMLPVMITGVLLVDSYDPRASQTQVTMKPDPAWGVPEGEWVELEDAGYRLASNEGALIQLGLAFAEDCREVDGGLSGLGPVRIRYSMLGVPRTALLETPAKIWLENLGDCPLQ